MRVEVAKAERKSREFYGGPRPGGPPFGDRGGPGGPPSRGGYDMGPPRGGYDDRGRGGYDRGAPMGAPRGGYDDRGRGGMDDRGRGGYNGGGGDRFGAPAPRELPQRDLPPRDRSRSRDRFREERPDNYRREERAGAGSSMPPPPRDELPMPVRGGGRGEHDGYRPRDELPPRDERPPMDEREHHHLQRGDEHDGGRGGEPLGELPPQ